MLAQRSPALLKPRRNATLASQPPPPLTLPPHRLAWPPRLPGKSHAAFAVPLRSVKQLQLSTNSSRAKTVSAARAWSTAKSCCCRRHVATAAAAAA